MFSFTNSQEKYRFNHCFLFYIRITAIRLKTNPNPFSDDLALLIATHLSTMLPLPPPSAVW